MTTFDLRDISFKTTPDFRKVYRKANEILACSKVIKDFPFKISDVINEQTDIRLCKYSNALGKYGIDVAALGSESAIILEYCGANVIFYNQDECPERIRFSIAHELGHYILRHKMNLEPASPLYEIQEIEANCFAAQLLMPEQLIREAIRRGKYNNTNFLIKAFGVSGSAAEKRVKTMASYDPEWRKSTEKEFDDVILFRFASFLDRIAPKNFIGFYDYEEEGYKQRERDLWLDTRSRWDR